MKKPRKQKPRHKKKRRGAQPLARGQASAALKPSVKFSASKAGAACAPIVSARPKPTPDSSHAGTARITKPTPRQKNRTRPAIDSALAAALPTVNADDRQALALLMAPVLLIAAMIGAQQTIRPGHLLALFAPPPVRIADLTPVELPRTAATLTIPPLAPHRQAQPRLPQAATAPGPSSVGRVSLRYSAAQINPQVALAASGLHTAAKSSAPARRIALPGPVPAASPEPAIVAGAPSGPPAELTPPRSGIVLMPNLPTPASQAASAAPDAPQIAALALPPRLSPAPLAPSQRHTCMAKPSKPQMAAALPRDRATFGLRLAEAAHARLSQFVFYSDAYRRLSYPLGDVPAMYGVCTDLVIRAYRALGIDLQQLVHVSRVGSGDRNIDHRRTATLRRFFAKYGTSLTVSGYAEDYRPGDIVTYYRPQNSRSRAHIAIVSHILGPSGRPMIIHNRGWGPQIEDALFVDKITGHYRYSGPAQGPRRVADNGSVEGSGLVVKASYSRRQSKLRRK